MKKDTGKDFFEGIAIFMLLNAAALSATGMIIGVLLIAVCWLAVTVMQR